MDLDPAALAYADSDWQPFGERFRAFQANFRAISAVLQAKRMSAIQTAFLSIWASLHCSLIRPSVGLVFVSTLL
jgi:16S rRNA C1402 N4-methylase RsmH